MADLIRLYEDKIKTSKVTHDIYVKEIEKIEKELESRGINANNIETQIHDLLGEIERLGKREKRLMRHIRKTIEFVEKRYI